MATIASRFSSDRARGDGATERARLQRLAAVDAGRHRVVTCYQKLEPRDRSRGKYLIKFASAFTHGQVTTPGGLHCVPEGESLPVFCCR